MQLQLVCFHPVGALPPPRRPRPAGAEPLRSLYKGDECDWTHPIALKFRDEKALDPAAMRNVRS
jgi:hypothetical protein